MNNKSLEQPQAPPSSFRPHLVALGDLFKGSWQYLVDHWQPLATISLIIFLPSIIEQLLSELTKGQTSIPLTFIRGFLTLLSIFLSLWGTLAFIHFFIHHKTFSVGQTSQQPDKSSGEFSVGQAFKQSTGHIIPYIWLAILGAVLVILGLVVLIVPGVVLGVYFSLGVYVLVSEGIKGWSALKRSLRLVRGYWWAVFGRQILLALIFFVLSFATLPFVIVPVVGTILSSLVFVALYIFAVPFGVYYTWRIYLNLKEVKEV